MEEFEVIYPVVTKQIYEGVLFDFKPIDNIASYHVRYSNFELQMFRPTGLDVWIFKAPQEFFDSLTMNEWRCWVAYLIGFSRSYHENFLFIESSDDDTKNYKLNSETKVLSIIYNTAIIAIDLIKDPDMYYEFYAKLLQNNLVPSLVVLYYFKTLPCYTGLYEHLLFLVTQFTANDKLQVNNEENNKTKGSLYPWWYSTKKQVIKVIMNKSIDTKVFKSKILSTDKVNNVTQKSLDVFYVPLSRYLLIVTILTVILYKITNFHFFLALIISCVSTYLGSLYRIKRLRQDKKDSQNMQFNKETYLNNISKYKVKILFDNLLK